MDHIYAPLNPEQLHLIQYFFITLPKHITSTWTVNLHCLTKPYTLYFYLESDAEKCGVLK